MSRIIMVCVESRGFKKEGWGEEEMTMFKILIGLYLIWDGAMSLWSPANTHWGFKKNFGLGFQMDLFRWFRIACGVALTIL